MGLLKIPMPAAADTDARRSDVKIWGLPVDSVVLEAQQYRPLYFLIKRVLDLVLAVILLMFFSPLLLLIAILIKLDSPGPIIFVQDRVGATPEIREKRIRWMLCSFPFFKFRSMVQNADPSWHQASVREFCSGGSEKGLGMRSKLHDTRTTRVGRVLRKTSLDELPQLVNVLAGQMSLIGPRPVPLYEVALYQEPQFKRLASIPGITGLWQASGRCQVSFEEMVRMDIHYAQNASLWLDLKILFLTIPAVLLARGAD
jgi:lipopolysaccharide/colanic/teichoic acid biosynthesis glycosyltransferase